MVDFALVVGKFAEILVEFDKLFVAVAVLFVDIDTGLVLEVQHAVDIALEHAAEAVLELVAEVVFEPEEEIKKN